MVGAGARDRLRWFVAVCSVAGVAAVAAASRADAYVYWANNGANTIGRGDLNGAWADQAFIRGAGGPYAVAVDGSHLYWSSNGGYSIGRANLDGSGVVRSFLTTPGHPLGLAVDGSYVYWSQLGGGIWRASLDGTGAAEQLVAYVIDGVNVAVDGSHLYWSAPVSTPSPTATGGIGRANLDGSGVEQGAGVTSPFIAGASQYVTGPAVDASHVYWVNAPYGKPGSIGRANLDGAGVEQSFVAVPAETTALAVGGSHLYFAYGFREIGRANLDGSGVHTSLVQGADDPTGLAVDSLSAPLLRLGRLKPHYGVGTATLTVRVLGRGRLTLSGRRVRTVVRSVSGPGTVRVPVKPRRSARRLLDKRGKLGVKVKVRFALSHGSVKVRDRRLRLARRGQ